MAEFIHILIRRSCSILFVVDCCSSLRHLVAIETAADAALAGVPLLGVAPVEQSSAALLGALTRSSVAAMHALSSRAVAGGGDRPTVSQATQYQLLSAVEILYQPEAFSAAFGGTGSNAANPLTAATMYAANSAVLFKFSFTMSFEDEHFVPPNITTQQLLLLASFKFGDADDEVSFSICVPLGMEGQPMQIQALAAATVADKFLGIVTGRPILFLDCVQRLLRANLGKVCSALTWRDAIRLTDSRLGQLPKMLARCAPPPPKSRDVGEPAAVQALGALLTTFLVVDTERVANIIKQRILRSLPPVESFPDEFERQTAGKRVGSLALVVPAKRVAAVAGGAGVAPAWVPAVPVHVAPRGALVAPPPLVPGVRGSRFSWSGSPVPPGSLPLSVCFYRVAGKAPCGGTADASRCANGFSHAPLTGITAQKKAQLAQWLVRDSGFVFR
jgi:hypothetical protein